MFVLNVFQRAGVPVGRRVGALFGCGDGGGRADRLGVAGLTSDEVIRIRRGAVRAKGGTYTITTPKSDAGIRDVAIPPHIIPLIEAHLAKYVGAGRDSLIFDTDNGGHLQPSTLYRWWYKARAAAGRPDLRWHDLRHSGAVLAAATGASLAELMARLGHSTPQAAMRYQHAAQGRDREIAALLSKLADA